MLHVFEEYDRTCYPIQPVYKFCPICQMALLFDAELRRQKCPACGFVHFRNPAPSITVCIVQDGKVLLSKRAFHPGQGKWAVPGGYIEIEEDFIAAGLREMKEETGLDIKITAIINIASSFISPEWHFLNVCMLAEVVGGELQVCDEFEAYCWYPLSASLPEMAFAEDIENLRLLALPDFHGLPVE